MAERDATILVVEDDHDIQSALASILREEGLHVATASDGAEALALLRQGLRPAVILLDLMMPVMNGAEFRAAQLQDPELAELLRTVRRLAAPPAPPAPAPSGHVAA